MYIIPFDIVAQPRKAGMVGLSTSMNKTQKMPKIIIGFTRGLILFTALLYLTICLPLMIVIYFPTWQKLN